MAGSVKANDLVYIEEYCRQMLVAEPTRASLDHFAGKIRKVLAKVLVPGPGGTLVPRDANYTARKQVAAAGTFAHPPTFTRFGGTPKE